MTSSFLKDPNDCHKLIINEETAPVVRKIFEMSADGVGLDSICKTLNGDGILNPTAYAYENGLSTIYSANRLWQTRTLNVMLKSETYIGNLVQGRHISINRKQVDQDPSKWIRCENTHQAIVSKELFDAAQKKKRTNATGKKWSENVFKGKIFCGHCGKNLHRMKLETGEYRFHCISNYRIKDDFCSYYFSLKENELVQIVLGIIDKEATVITGKSLELQQKSSAINSRLEDNKAKLAEISKEVVKNQALIKSLYENRITGVITDDDYLELKQVYEQKVVSLRTEHSEVQSEITTLTGEIDAFKTLCKTVKSNKRKTKLSRELVDALIDTITVYDTTKVDVKFSYKSLFPHMMEVLGSDE